jgi:hypothetical protein
LAGREFTVKSLSRLFLLAGIVLLSATSLPAQHFISGGSAPSFSGWGGYGGGFGGYGFGDYGWGYSYGGWGFGDCDLHRPQEHPPFGVGYGHGDPEFTQSTYMDYSKAVELGKKILEEQAKPQPSLGEIARQLRARARTYVPPPAPRSSAAPSRPDSFVVIQDVQGRPILCRSSDATCRNTA